MKKMFKVSSFLRCLVVLFSSFSIIAFAEEGETEGTEEPTILLGDMDLNGKVDAGGGGTVAKYIANLDVDVVDLGVPVLSMHAPYEVISKLDLYMAYRAFTEFFKQ